MIFSVICSGLISLVHSVLTVEHEVPCSPCGSSAESCDFSFLSQADTLAFSCDSCDWSPSDSLFSSVCSTPRGERSEGSSLDGATVLEKLKRMFEVHSLKESQKEKFRMDFSRILIDMSSAFCTLRRILRKTETSKQPPAHLKTEISAELEAYMEKVRLFTISNDCCSFDSVLQIYGSFLKHTNNIAFYARLIRYSVYVNTSDSTIWKQSQDVIKESFRKLYKLKNVFKIAEDQAAETSDDFQDAV